MNIPGDANEKLPSSQDGSYWEKQLEDLCLEKLRLEREDTTQEPADNIEQQAKAQARYQVRRAKIQAIDCQIEELALIIARNEGEKNERVFDPSAFLHSFFNNTRVYDSKGNERYSIKNGLLRFPARKT